MASRYKFRMYYYILKTVQYHSVQCYLLLVKIFCVLVDPSSHLAFSTKGVWTDNFGTFVS